jgi:hypothetical protein
MAGHSRSWNGVASLAYVPAISIQFRGAPIIEMPGIKPGMTANHIVTFKLTIVSV